jgi:O-antigen/teichoic acid export membrane protein
MIAASRQTLLANLVQQASAAVVLLALPNILGKADYAQTVFVGVLLSFMALADVGMSLVYGRLVPALIAQGDMESIRRWDASVLQMGLLASLAFAGFVSTVYWVRYEYSSGSILLALLPVAMYWTSFHVTRVTASGDFSEYRRAISVRSLASLLAIPMAAGLGLLGWFASQVAAAVLVLGYIGRRLLAPFGSIDWILLRKHVPEGLILCAITVMWMQLLNLGRLYASLRYSPEAVAHYGVAGAAYQFMAALIISAFLPVSVQVLGRFGRSDKDAFEFMGRILANAAWFVLTGTVLMVEIAPFALDLVFPSYHFDSWMLCGLLLGVAFYPFFILFGNCLVGKQKGRLYLALLVVGLAAGGLAAMVIDMFSWGQGAAWGQLLGLTIYTALLYGASRALFHKAAPATWNKAGKSLAGVCLFLAVYGAMRAFWI